MSKEKIFVFDSYAFMAYFHKQSGYESVGRFLKKAQEGECRIMMSIINWGEIYYSIYRGKGKDVAEESLILITQLPIAVMDVDRDLVYKAAQIKSRYAISYGDCFAAALACQNNCSVITGDKEFKKIEHEVQVTWL